MGFDFWRRPVMWVIFACLALIVVASLHADDNPAATAGKVDYARDILPILQANCAKCHLNGAHKGGMDLSSRDNLLKGGDSEEPAVVPHDSAKSRIIQLVTADDPDDMMPKKGKRLPAEQIEVLKKWIDQGMPWDDAAIAKAQAPKYAAPLEPRHVEVPKAEPGSHLTNPIDLL